MAGELKAALDNNTKKKMPPALLRKHIQQLFKKATMCVICTTNGLLPRATPLEFYPDGMDLYIATQAGTKVKNLRVNKHVSLSVTNAVKVDWMKQWDKVWGMQITGIGEMFEYGSPEWQKGCDVIDYGTFMEALGISGPSIGPSSRVIRITISKLELFDYALLNKGYTYKQVWEPAKSQA